MHYDETHIALFTIFMMAVLGGQDLQKWECGSSSSSLTAGRSKYHPVEKAKLTEDEKIRNAEIDARKAARKAAKLK